MFDLLDHGVSNRPCGTRTHAIIGAAIAFSKVGHPGVEPGTRCL